MSGEDPLNIKVISTVDINNQRLVKYEVPSYKGMEKLALLRGSFVPTGEVVTVTTSENCPKEDVEAIKALCRERGYNYYEDAAHAGRDSSGSSSGKPSTGCGKGND